MIQYEELKPQVTALAPKLADLKNALKIGAAEAEIAEIEEASSRPDFWNDAESSSAAQKKLGGLRRVVEKYTNICTAYDDVMTMIELANEANDEESLPEITAMSDKFRRDLEQLQLSTMLSGEYDGKSAIITLHAGAGGTEACDWVLMMYRMYVRYAERHGFKTKTLAMLDGEEAGIKSASVLIEGENAYGFLKSEHGVHRLVRVSPFDSSGRRHTSFASMEVMP